MSESKKIADYCATYDINIAPHNFYSHMSTLMSAHLCASINNVRIMESDPDDVPWKDDILTEPLQIENGYLILPKKPGWGADINEKELAKHPWDK
jgi:galactonate dehydratase